MVDPDPALGRAVARAIGDVHDEIRLALPMRLIDKGAWQDNETAVVEAIHKVGCDNPQEATDIAT